MTMLQTLVTGVVVVALWRRLGTLIRNYVIKRTLGLREYEELGRKRPGGKIKGTAVVAGGRYVLMRVLSQFDENSLIYAE